MKKYTLVLALGVSFCFGFGVKTLLNENTAQNTDFRKVTGIGGIFFKCRDPKQLRQWYQVNLGLNTNPYGCVFEWRQAEDSSKKGFSQWSPFAEKTKYFEPSTKDFMVNYRVADMDRLVAQLKRDGITFTDSVQSFEYGKFVHILDLEGNKIELWQPNDAEYEKMGLQMGLGTSK